jgi:hypothetical protein
VAAGGDVPASLTRFVAAEWGADVDAPALWYAARERWREAGNDLPHLPGADLPDVAWEFV